MENSLEKSLKVKKIISQVIIYFLLTFWAIVVIFPFFYMIITSIKTVSDYNSEIYPQFIPKNPTFDNFKTVWTTIEIDTYLINTVVFAITTTLFMVIVTILASFAFARLQFKGKNLAFTLFLSMMMLPQELIILTNYVTVSNLGFKDTFVGLIFPSVLSVFYIYLLRQNFMQVSDSLYYAAKVDGVTDMGYLFKVLIPLSRPTIVSIIILKIIECWNSYIWPKRIISGSNKTLFVVSLGIEEVRKNGFGRDNIPAMMAMVLIVSVPLLIIYFIFRRQIMSGVSRTGTKG